MSTKNKPNINSKSPTLKQAGLFNKIGKIENNYITQYVKPHELREWLKKLTTNTKEDRIKEVEEWYDKGRFESTELKQALILVIEHIDTELKASQATIEKLRKEGEWQLADTLEKLNEAFKKTDVEQLLRIHDTEQEVLKKREHKLINNRLVMYRDVSAKLETLLQYNEAVKNYWQAIHLQRNAGMTENAAYAADLNSLALVYDAQGKYEDAVPLFRDALKIVEKVLGKEHPQYAADLNSLALVYDAQGKYEDAVPLFRDALKIVEKVLGKDHPDTRKFQDNLNLALSRLSR